MLEAASASFHTPPVREQVFDRDGIVLDGNSLPASIGWSEAVGKLPADGGAARRRGWAPPADLAALAALAEGAQGYD